MAYVKNMRLSIPLRIFETEDLIKNDKEMKSSWVMILRIRILSCNVIIII